MKITGDFIKKLTYAAINAHPDEIGCDGCYDKLHEFAELKLEGKSPEQAKPLIQDHLERCNDCREEFEALLDALRNLQHPV